MTDEAKKTTAAGREAAEHELDDAFKSLQDAFMRLKSTVEGTAKEEWERAKPEVQSSLGDLQRVIDAAAERAKIALGDLGKKIDPDDPNRVN